MNVKVLDICFFSGLNSVSLSLHHLEDLNESSLRSLSLVFFAALFLSSVEVITHNNTITIEPNLLRLCV